MINVFKYLWYWIRLLWYYIKCSAYWTFLLIPVIGFIIVLLWNFDFIKPKF